jgi:hypothetical protein
LFRKAGSYYFRKKIQPYLTLPGLVEMDETYLGSTKFNTSNKIGSVIRWIFGLFCRDTKITLMYYIKQKDQASCFNVCKKHIPAGNPIISDMHSIYCQLHSSTSNMTKHGWYHMWSNHSETMVHRKFLFVHSMNIECQWRVLKGKFSAINCAQKASTIQDWCNVFTMHRCILKSEHRYSFWLKMIRYYYQSSVEEL